jgi:hypothetical protein
VWTSRLVARAAFVSFFINVILGGGSDQSNPPARYTCREQYGLPVAYQRKQESTRYSVVDL